MQEVLSISHLNGIPFNLSPLSNVFIDRSSIKAKSPHNSQSANFLSDDNITQRSCGFNNPSEPNRSVCRLQLNLKDKVKINYKDGINYLLNNECSEQYKENLSVVKQEVLPNPSYEQKDVLTYFAKGYNIKINAVAGAGKTTTLLMCGQEAAKLNKTCTILTYNRALKDDINDRIKSLGLSKYIEAYTYHGIVSKIHETSICNDIKMVNILNQKEANPNALASHVWMIDEAQDLTDYIHSLLLEHIYRIPNRQVIVVGDVRQFINEFRGAKVDFFVQCEKVFQSGRPWISLQLNTSYRLTPSIANFVNKHVINQEMLIGGNTKNDGGLLPIYKIGVWDLMDVLKEELNNYDINDIAIISASVRKAKDNFKSPVGRLLNISTNVLFHITDNNIDEVDSIITQNKLLISTFNAMKGREKKCIILLNFDESYFKYYARDWKEESIPNILYVAATRAKEKLIILQTHNSNPLRSIQLDRLAQDSLCYVIPKKVDDFNDNFDNSRHRRSFFVTDVLRHRDPREMIQMMKLISIIEVTHVDSIEQSSGIIKFNNYYEEVSSYYGIAIPMLAEIIMKNGACKRIDEHDLSDLIMTMTENYKYKINPSEIIASYLLESNEYEERSYRQELDKELLDLLYKFHFNKEPRILLQIVVLMESRNDKGYIRNQIRNYNWVDEKYIEFAAKRIVDTLPNGGIFECHLSSDSSSQLVMNAELQGRADYIDPSNTIWELKCSKSDSREEEHLLQLAAYLCISEAKIGKLYNIISGKITTIHVTNKSQLLRILLNH